VQAWRAKCPYQEERGAADVELLLAHSAEINIRDREGMTPLHLAGYGWVGVDGVVAYFERGIY